MIMSDKEIHKTEFVDKGTLPTIYIKKQQMKSMSDKSELILQVSDKSSEAALKTLEKIREYKDF